MTEQDITSGICFLVHGDAKSGKSWLSDSCPRPRLILDAEGGNAVKWTPSRKKKWKPLEESPPEDDGTWDSCVVNVRDFQTMNQVYEWLNSGQHPFKSVSLDSISEIQQRAMDSLVGVNALKQADWGELDRMVSSLVRKFRDLTDHQIKPLQVVVFIAMTKLVDGKWRPFVQGGLATKMPYYLDVVGYLTIRADELGNAHRDLMIEKSYEYLSGERVGGRLGPYIRIPDWDETIVRMLDMINNPQVEGTNS